MAIIIEEEKNGTGAVRILLWLLIVVVIAVAGYYIFFAKPELVGIIAVPPNLQSKNIDTLAGIDFNQENVINSQEFQMLKQYITSPEPGNAGRSNPFVP